MKTVRDIMTANPATCLSDTPIQDIGRMMVDCDCGSIPVLESTRSRRPIGTVTDRDIVCRLVAQGRNPMQCVARDCMTTPCITVPVDADADTARDLMSRHQIRRVVVVDENGGCVGVVALADIVRETGDATVIREVSEPSDEAANILGKMPEPV